MRRYIVFEGVLFWGLLTATSWSIAIEVWKSGSINILALNFLIRSLIASIIFSVGGLIVGWLSWVHMERKYLKETSGDRPNRRERMAQRR